MSQTGAVLALEEQIALLKRDLADKTAECDRLHEAIRRREENEERRDRERNALKERIAKLEELAQIDLLTGLLNRRGFDEEMKRFLSSVVREQKTGTLVFIDLDKFKWVNDICDHDAGDQLLMAIGHVLKTTFRPTDYVARWGGDEFVILLKDVHDRTLAKHVVNHALRKVRALMIAHERVDILKEKRGDETVISFTAGYFVIRDGNDTTSVLVKIAEADNVKYRNRKGQ